jgi:hypothetical protein
MSRRTAGTQTWTLRLVLTLCLAGTLLLAPTAADAVPPPGINVTLFELGGHCVVSANFKHAVLGQALLFSNNTGADQQVAEKAGFWSFAVPRGAFDQDPTMDSAGKYFWTCDGGGNYMPDPVVMSGPKSSSGPFTLTWATASAPTTYRYTVVYKVGASGSTITWQAGVASRAGTFSPTQHGVTYYFRARTIRTTSAKSGWSPWMNVSVT